MNQYSLNFSKKLWVAAPAAVLAGQADGAIVFTDLGEGVSNSDVNGVYFDFVAQSATTEFYSGYQFLVYSKGTINNGTLETGASASTSQTAVSSGSAAKSFAEGETIDDGESYSQWTFDSSAWTTGGDAEYAGFVFEDEGSTYYGWALISLSANWTVTLYSFAYENSGAAIAAGATPSPVPEPAESALAVGLLAGTAAAFAARRRRAQKAA